MTRQRGQRARAHSLWDIFESPFEFRSRFGGNRLDGSHCQQTSKRRDPVGASHNGFYATRGPDPFPAADDQTAYFG